MINIIAKIDKNRVCLPTTNVFLLFSLSLIFVMLISNVTETAIFTFCKILTARSVFL